MPEIFSVKWTSMVLHALHLHGGVARTGVLTRSLPRISKKILIQTLREVERDGLIGRKIHPVVPRMVEYSLMPLGDRFIEPLFLLYEWGEKNAKFLKQITRRRRSVLEARKPKRKN